MNSKNLQIALISGLLALLVTLPAAAANPAGTAVFVSGKASATDPAGSTRQLKARDPVFSGDLLETGKGRIQIKFLDGAFISIQPNSKFQIEDYNYTSGSDGSEKAVYNLFKGGMRAFTGAIGKKHPDAYKVKTPVATIGIRGTGHNTRICSGDCTNAAGLPLPDGLYHTTWENTTFVETNAGITEVPFGNSVYVETIDSPVQQTNQASVVTAVQPSEGTADELADEQEDQVVLEAGEQVNCGGGDCAPVILPPPPPPPDLLTLQVGLNQVSVAPPQPASEDSVDISLLFETTEFIGPAGPIGAYGTDVNDGPPGTGTLATIDPLAILASPSPAADGAKALINNAMANPENDALFDAFYANPASIAEFTVDSGIGFGRWYNGLVLLFEDGGSVALKALENDDSLHFIFGNSPAVAAEGAIGTYDFIGGTDSTGSLGDGVTDGQLTFDFGDMTGTIAMTVSHGILYTIEGDLLIDVVFPSLFAGVGLVATTTDGNCSEGGCTAFVEGSFFGPLVEGAPAGAGLEYDIEEGSEVIMGVAAFTRVANPPPPPPPLPQSLLGIETNLFRSFSDPDNADGGLISSATVLVGEDSNATRGLIGVIGTETDEDDTGLGVDETLDLLITIDPNAILALESPDANVIKAQGFLNDAMDGGANEALVNSVITNPATVAEYTEGTHLGSNYEFGRLNDGNLLFIDEVLDGPNIGVRTVEVDNLGINDHFHHLNGDVAETNFGIGATGTYNLLADRGTDSTDTHAGFIGNGVQSGRLVFDFTSLDGTINMTVDHGALYTVAGDLKINPGAPGEFFNVPYGVSADGGTCDPECETLIDGSFFGKLASPTGADGAPVLSGLEYEILTAPFNGEDGNSIIGNAIFGRDGTAAPIPDIFTVIPDQGLVFVLPNLDPSPPPGEFADIGLFAEATNIVGDDRLNKHGLLTTIGFEFDDDSEDEFFVVVTIDPVATLAVTDTDPNVLGAQGLIAGAQTSHPLLVADVIASPAKLAEYFPGNGIAWGRWADGSFLFLAEIYQEGEPSGIKTVEKKVLTDYQSLAFVTGDSPATPLQGASGEYQFIGGTQSTTASGSSIGQGVTSGVLTFYFGAEPSGFLNMTVNHLTDYNVSGSLAFDNSGTFYDTGVDATGGTCGEGCTTFIDGGFAGALAGGPGGSPIHAGLEYDIDVGGGDGILGVAAFERTSAAPD